MHTHTYAQAMYYVHIRKLAHINHLQHCHRLYILVYLLCVDHKHTDPMCLALLLLVNSKPWFRKAVCSSYAPSKPDVSNNNFVLCMMQIGPQMVYFSP